MSDPRSLSVVKFLRLLCALNVVLNINLVASALPISPSPTPSLVQKEKRASISPNPSSVPTSLSSNMTSPLLAEIGDATELPDERQRQGEAARLVVVDPREGACSKEELDAVTAFFNENRVSCTAYKCVEDSTADFLQHLNYQHPESWADSSQVGAIDTVASLLGACACRCAMMKCEVDFMRTSASDLCVKATVDYCDEQNQKFAERCGKAAMKYSEEIKAHGGEFDQWTTTCPHACEFSEGSEHILSSLAPDALPSVINSRSPTGPLPNSGTSSLINSEWSDVSTASPGIGQVSSSTIVLEKEVVVAPEQSSSNRNVALDGSGTQADASYNLISAAGGNSYPRQRLEEGSTDGDSEMSSGHEYETQDEYRQEYSSCIRMPYLALYLFLIIPSITLVCV